MRFDRVVLVAGALLAAGCIQGQRVIKVNADGSGTITDTVTLGEQARSMMEAMSQMDQTPAAEKKTKKMTKLSARAAAMGPGVTVLSFDPSVKGGPEKVTYAFKDISAIKIDPTPDSSENDAKQDAPAEKKDQLTFKLDKKGATSVLTVLGAGPKPSAKSSAPATPADKQAAEMAAQMQAQSMAMMKTMMKGLKMTTILEVQGKIVKTNALNVVGPQVTLLDLDFDQITADEANFKKFADAGDDPKTMDVAALKGIKGIKVQTAPEVTIEFGK